MAIGARAEAISSEIVGYAGASVTRGSTTAIGIQFGDVTSVTEEIPIVDLLTVTGSKANTKANSAGANVDKLMVWRTNKYETYYLSSELGGWVKSGAEEDGITTDTVKPGDGIFFKKASSTAGSYNIAGKVLKSTDVETITLSRNQTTFLCYPWPVEVEIQSIAGMIAGAKSNTAANSAGQNVDKIMVWRTNKFETYYNSSELGGYVKSGESALTTDTIDAGAGFFLKKASSTAESITFTAPAGLE